MDYHCPYCQSVVVGETCQRCYAPKFNGPVALPAHTWGPPEPLNQNLASTFLVGVGSSIAKITFFLILLFATRANANWTDCVCNIQGPKLGGSGTLVAVSPDRHGLIISAAHVFEDGNTDGIVCEFPAIKKKYRAKVLACQSRNDIAALDIANAPQIELPPAIVAGKKEDAPFTCVGFPFDSRHELRSTKGRYLGYENDGPLLTLQQVRSGYSGGGRFNRYGEYVGPISGMQGDNGRPMDRCWGASGKAMLEFVGRFVRQKHASN
jgi:hypothetical protein